MHQNPASTSRSGPLPSPESLGGISLADIGRELQKINTHLYLHSKAMDKGASVLISVSEPGSYRAVLGVIHRLVEDPRVKHVLVFAAGQANVDLCRDIPVLAEHTESKSDPLKTLLSLRDQHPNLSVLLTPEGIVGPSFPVMFGAPDFLKPRAIRLMVESPDSMLGLGIVKGRELGFPLNSILEVLCNDELTREVARSRLPEVPTDRFIVTGTGQSDAVQNSAFEYPKLNEETRVKLNIPQGDKTVLFLGDLDNYPELPEEIRPEWQIKTLEQTYDALDSYLENNPSDRITLLVRPHPRDPQGAQLISKLQGKMQGSPSRIKIISAGREICSFDAAMAVSDLVVSTTRTEICNAPSRNKQGVFLAFSGLGELVFETVHPALKSAISDAPGLAVASSSIDLLAALHRFLDTPQKAPPAAGDKIDSSLAVCDRLLI